MDKLVLNGGYGIQLVKKIYSKGITRGHAVLLSKAVVIIGIAEWIAESMEMSCSDIYSVIAGGRGREVPRT